MINVKIFGISDPGRHAAAEPQPKVQAVRVVEPAPIIASPTPTVAMVQPQTSFANKNGPGLSYLTIPKHVRESFSNDSKREDILSSLPAVPFFALSPDLDIFFALQPSWSASRRLGEAGVPWQGHRREVRPVPRYFRSLSFRKIGRLPLQVW